MATPHEVFRQVLAETGDGIKALKEIRLQFGLSLVEAKEVMLQAEGVANSLQEHQARLADALEQALQYDRITGSPPMGFSYIPDFLDPDEQEALLRILHDLEFVHDTFRGQRLKRSYAQFGYAYASTGRRLTPAVPLPDCLLDLIDRAKPHVPEGCAFNQCIVTHYPKGSGIGWHTDAVRFGECIMAVSLGDAARVQFRANGTEQVACEVMTSPGSLYVMHGPARWNYQHQVVPVAADRYALTFRLVAD
jgi:alkylated DNA repair dioxygenase AlkB